MKVYVELKSGKWIETTLYLEKIQESLVQLMGSLEAFYQISIDDIKAISYNPVRHTFKPYSISHFDNQVDIELLNQAKVSHKLNQFFS